MRRPPPTLLFLVVFGAALQPVTAADWARYYPEYGAYQRQFRMYTDGVCSEQWFDFKHNSFERCRKDKDPKVACGLATVLVDCVLDNFTDGAKANMASAAVLLGFLPTSLGLVGSSTDELGLLALRRPFLASLLTVGASTVSQIRTFQHEGPQGILAREFAFSAAGAPPRALVARFSLATIAVQYIVAVAAAANTLHNSWQVSNLTFNSFDLTSNYYPLVWTVSTVALCLLGGLSVRVHAALSNGCTSDSARKHTAIASPPPGSPGSRRDDALRTGLRDAFTSAWSGLRSEFSLSLTAEPCIDPARESKPKQGDYKMASLLVLATWATSVFTVLHMIFGTVIFSGTLFVGMTRALTITARYLASVIAGRAILMFEITGMRIQMKQDRTGGLLPGKSDVQPHHSEGVCFP